MPNLLTDLSLSYCTSLTEYSRFRTQEVMIGNVGRSVNGPEETADAEYGYAEIGPGKTTRYKEKEVVQRTVPTEQVVDACIDLIKSHEAWVEPQHG
ncbi:MAG: hypothetical protein AAGB22_14070 [Bacteroidota bacterium]